MIKTTLKLSLAVAIVGLLASSGYAGPLTLNDAQMDGVTAGMGHKVEGFVCPVVPGKGLANNDKFFALGDSGYYSFIGPDVAVPMHATNRNGAGRPAFDDDGNPLFAAPGGADYSPIWGFRP